MVHRHSSRYSVWTGADTAERKQSAVLEEGLLHVTGGGVNAGTTTYFFMALALTHFFLIGAPYTRLT